MIKLKLNNKEELIPSANELTVQQYIDLHKREKIDLINYLSVVMGIDWKSAFNLKINNFAALKNRIGAIQDYQKIPPKKKITLNDDNYFFIKEEIDTVGERWMIEENARELTGEELLVFILAVSLVSDPMDFDKVSKMKENLLNQNYLEILPTAFFLQLRFLIGRNSGLSFFNQLMFKVKTSILKSKQVWITLADILIILKYKLYLRY